MKRWLSLILICLLTSVAGAQDFDDQDLDFMLDETPLSGLTGKERATEVDKILARQTPQEDFELLRQILTQGNDTLAHEQAAFELLLSSGAPGILEIGQQLLSHQIPYKQTMGARLMGATGRQDALDPLLKLGQAGAADKDLRFAIIEALATLADPKAIPLLTKWADDYPRRAVTGRELGPDRNALLARLALVHAGAPGNLAEALAESEAQLDKQAMLAHELVVMRQHWTPGQLQNARRDFALRARYLDLVSLLVRRLPAEQLEVLIAFLDQRAGSRLLSLISVETPTLAVHSPATALRLLAIDNPDFRTLVAEALVVHGQPATIAIVQDYLRNWHRSTDWQARALAIRLVDLWPPDEQVPALRQALQDARPYVREEALRLACQRRDTALREAIDALDTSHPRIGWWVRHYHQLLAAGAP